jgi:hypothetical protein
MQFTEMVLITRTEYDQLLRCRQIAAPCAKATDKLESVAEQKCDEALQTEAPDGVKVKLYQDALRNLIRKKRKCSQMSPPISSDRTEKNWEEQILKSVPRKFQARARSLWSAMQSAITVLDTGEIRIDEQSVTHSNIVDLISHAVRDSKPKKEPEGWQSFFRVLRASNVPLTALGKWLQMQSQESKGDQETGFGQPWISLFSIK